MISADVLAAYDASRAPGTDRSVLCHAPFVSLNFDQSGQVSACCFNRHYALGTYPAQTVSEIWNGAPAKALREAFLTGTDAPGCDRCFDQLKNRNFSGALMRNFDRYTAGRVKNVVRHGRGASRAAGADGPPLALEFEISNTCTLECVMCGGHWSSAIRERREKLPPLRNPYDGDFVQQIEEFLPTIVAANFLGGEPFLINRYHEIWDGIRRLNPDARISITTSGAILPDRSRLLLEQLRASIIVSLDGMTAPTYESIRVNARFDDVMKNITYFRDYTRRRNTTLTAAVCPMTHNWRELAAIVRFCEERDIAVYFNTVTFPIESSLAGLAERDLTEVIDQLEIEGRTGSASWTANTRAQWQSLTNQLRGWREEKRRFPRHCAEVANRARAFAAVHLGNGEATPMDGALVSIEPLIEALVVVNEVQRERERARLGRGTLEGSLLPQSPLALWSEGGVPGVRDLLLAAHVTRRFANAAGSTGADAGEPTLGEADRPSVLDEHRQLRLLLDRMLESAETRSRFERLGTWMHERLRQADVRAVFDITDVMLESTEARHVLLLGEPEELRRKLDGGWQHLEVDSLDEPDRIRIKAYFDRLVAFHSLKKFMAADDAGAGVEAELVRRIKDLQDVQAVLHAADLFHICFGPAAKHESFRRRLNVVRGALTPERSGAILNALQKTDVTQIYTFMSTVSDEEFAARIHAIAS